MNLFEWMQETKEFGWSPATSRELRSLLRPRVRFSRPIRWPTQETEGEKKNSSPRVKDLIDWEVVLCSGADARYHLKTIQQLPGWLDSQVDLLPSLTTLLKDAFDLMAELDGASPQYDHSYIHHPSISEHQQNQHFMEWTLLIDLCRDAWVEAARRDLCAAAGEFNRWKEIKYPVFRRLSMFAAATSVDVVSSDDAIHLLTDQDAWWLWSTETQREAIRLLCALAPRISINQADTVTTLVMNGPPRSLYRADLTDAQWSEVRDRVVWLRLAKFLSCNGHLNQVARATVDGIAAKYPGLQLATDDRDEFASYMFVGRTAPWNRTVTLPGTRKELAAALRDRPADDIFYSDNLQDLLQKRLRVVFGALLQLAQEKSWPAGAWQSTLQFLSEPTSVRRGWIRLHRALLGASDDHLRAIGAAATWWLQAVANAIPLNAEPAFMGFIDRMMNLENEGSTLARPVTLDQAINHPLGHISEALIRWWYRTTPKVAGLLPPAIRDRFSRLLGSHGTASIARVTLAAHLSNLFIVDPAWTREQLLPCFSWRKNASVALSVWDAYLGNPNISTELASEFKGEFLDTAEHYDDLGDYGKQYAGLLGVSFIEITDVFSVAEKRAALRAIGAIGLAVVAQRITVALGNAGDRREEYWMHRVKPLLEQAWPKSSSFRSGEESCAFAEMSIRAGRRFPEALAFLSPWLLPTRECRLIASHLAESTIPAEHPSLAIKLLASIVDVNERWAQFGLADVLNTIETVDPSVRDNQDFRRLREYVEQYDIR